MSCKDCGAPIEPVEVRGNKIEPRYCGDCVERRRTDAADVRSLEHEREYRDALERSNISERERAKSIPLRDDVATLLDQPDPPLHNGLYLCGQTDSGKTSQLCALVQEFLRRAYIDEQSRSTAYFVTEAELLRSLRGNGPVESDRLLDADLLAIDELGSQETTEWAAGQLFEVINQRYNNLGLTAFASNRHPQELVELSKARAAESGRAAAYDDRALRRIEEMCNVEANPDDQQVIILQKQWWRG